MMKCKLLQNKATFADAVTLYNDSQRTSNFLPRIIFASRIKNI